MTTTSFASRSSRRCSRDKSMADELTCSVCLELFSNPVILECSHNLCLECARRLLVARRTNREVQLCFGCGLLRRSRKRVAITCPLCARETVVTSKSGLRPNLALRNLVDQFRTGPLSDSGSVGFGFTSS
eukprot:RCo018444